MKKFNILIVDDEKRIINFLRSKLTAQGYQVATATDGIEAVQQFNSHRPDLVVLDVLMPRMNGFEVLSEIRKHWAVPVIMVSAKSDAEDRIMGLNLGADDYVAKPFSPDELVARIEALRRRSSAADAPFFPQNFKFGDLDIDFAGRSVKVKGEEKYLTRIEWLLLGELSRNAGKVTLYDDLLTNVWGREYRSDIQFLRTWISRLRGKLEQDPPHPTLIRTVPKSGYMINIPLSATLLEGDYPDGTVTPL